MTERKWTVQQAYPIDDYPVAPGTEFWLTQKLNGVRATYFNGEMVSRNGRVFKGLEHITALIESSPMAGYALDGELTLMDKGTMSDNEAFRTATGILNSNSESKPQICYTVFDIIPLEEFMSSHQTTRYLKRRELLDEFAEYVGDNHALRILPVLYHGKDQGIIDILLEQMVAEDKEGLMLNLDVPYKRTRHRGILKIKKFYTMDLKIIGYEEGTGRTAGMLGAFLVDFQGNTVKVGTGFTEEQREEYWLTGESMVGKLCEVKYKEISANKKTGKKSLQFPVFVGLRTDKTEVSYG